MIFSRSYENFTVYKKGLLCFCFFPLGIHMRLAVISLCLTTRIITIPLAAGMTDKIITAGHAHQNRALRKHIIEGLTGYQYGIRYQTSNIKTEYITAPVSIFRVFLFCFRHIRISEDISIRSSIRLSQAFFTYCSYSSSSVIWRYFSVIERHRHWRR